MDRTRVLIRTPWKSTLQHTVNLHMGGELYKVHIVEETWSDNRKCSCQARSSLRSSEEIDSGDSDTGSPISKFVGALGTDYAQRGIDGNSIDGGMTKGNLPLPNGTTTDNKPGDSNPVRWALHTDNKTSMSALGAVNEMASAAQPRLETVACCDNEETFRAQREPCNGSRE